MVILLLEHRWAVCYGISSIGVMLAALLNRVEKGE
jgi:hypothetical protein